MEGGSSYMSENNIYYCVGCGEIHPENSFYKSKMSDHANGRLFYCKDYLKARCYKANGDIDEELFVNYLRQLNVAFLPDLLEASIESGKDIIGAYFAKYNGLNQYKGMSWDDGVSLEDIAEEEAEEEELNSLQLDDFVVTPMMIKRWGSSYSKKDIRNLETFYGDMHKAHSITTPTHERALITLCRLQLKMDAYLDGDEMTEFSKVHKEYQSVLASSGFRPIDNKGGSEQQGMKSFSQMSEMVERDGFVKPKKTKATQDIVDWTITYMNNYTLKLLNKPVLTSPPEDTPKVGK